MKESFRYFLGKFCTIITVGVNYSFKFEEMNEYYAGIVMDVSDHAILLMHHITKCKSLILLDKVVSIHEEQVVFPDNPENAKLIEEYRKEKPVTAAKTVMPQGPYVDPAALAELAKRAKQPNQ